MKNNDIEIFPYVVKKIGNIILGIDGKSNFIFEIGNKNTRIVGKICDCDEDYGFFSIEGREDKVYLLPDLSDKFVVFDKQRGETKALLVGGATMNKERKIGCFQSFWLADTLVTFRIILEGYFKINFHTNEICYYNNPLFSSEKLDTIVYGSGTVINNIIYLPIYGTNTVAVYSEDSELITYRKIPIEDALISALCSARHDLFAVSNNGKKIFCISEIDWTVKVMELTMPIGFKQSSEDSNTPQVFMGCIYYEGMIWLIPYYITNGVIVYCVKDKCVNKYIQYDECQVFTYSVGDNVLYLCTSSGLIEINMDEFTISNKRCFLEGEDVFEYIKNQYDKSNIIQEKDIKLSSFLQYVESEKI